MKTNSSPVSGGLVRSVCGITLIEFVVIVVIIISLLFVALRLIHKNKAIKDSEYQAWQFFSSLAPINCDIVSGKLWVLCQKTNGASIVLYDGESMDFRSVSFMSVNERFPASIHSTENKWTPIVTVFVQKDRVIKTFELRLNQNWFLGGHPVEWKGVTHSQLNSVVSRMSAESRKDIRPR